MASTYKVHFEETPNPNSLKFVIDPAIAAESAQFSSPNETYRSPLARKIFGFPWAAGVFIGPNFVTITKQEWVDWNILAEPLADLLKEHLDRGEGVLLAATSAQGASGNAAEMQATEHGSNLDLPGDLAVVKRIKQILRDEIQPAVAMDGGDIEFQGYEEGKVYLHLRGACSGCPSSLVTLKDGIETRLKQALPEVVEVLSI